MDTLDTQFYDSRGTFVAVVINKNDTTELQTVQQKLYFGKDHPMSKAIREMVLEQNEG